MASFADNIPQFKPYVSQLPVELMMEVGVYKQQKYDQNVEKLQSYFDNVIGGMDMANEADRNYAQSLINQVGSNMKWLVGGDFSNQQLVNSVGNMATQITKDPNILNAVSSTALYRQQRAKIQKDIDEGKSNPANIDDFDKQAAPWLNSKKVGQKFNGQYTPFFDVDKFTKEQFDAVKPRGFTFDMVYALDSNGKMQYDKETGKPIYSPTMTRLKKEGRLPQEVEATISQIMADPRVTQQLNITGKYNYKGLDPQNLITAVYDQRDAKLNSYLNKMADLNLDKQLGKDVQADIDALQSSIDNITNSYDELASTANTNPDGLRGYLYKQGVIDNYKSIYGSISVSEESMANPGWHANFELLKEANAQRRWLKDFQWKQNNAVADRIFTANENRLKRETDVMIASMKARGEAGVPGFGLFENYGNVTLDDDSSGLDAVVQFENQKTQAANNFLDKSYGFIWNAFYEGNPKADKNVRDIMSKDSSIKKDDAVKIVMNNMAKKANLTPEEFMSTYGEKAANRINRNLATASPKLIGQYIAFKNAQQEYNIVTAKDKQYTDQASKENPGTDLAANLATLNIEPVEVSYNDKKYKLTKEDFYDAAIYANGYKTANYGLNPTILTDAAKAAQKRLAARGKEFILDTTIDQFGQTLASRGSSSILGAIGNSPIGNPITGVTRMVKRAGKNIGSIFGNEAYLEDESGWDIGPRVNTPGGTSDRFTKALQAAYNLVSQEGTVNALTRKGELIKNDAIFKPNVKIPILTGQDKYDKGIYQKVIAMAANYVERGANLAPKGDPEKFLSAVSGGKISKPHVFEGKITEVDGKPMVRLVSFGNSGVSGSLVISEDEAASLNINVGAIYEPPEVTATRRVIYSSANKRTSAGDPSNLETYRSGDSMFPKWKLPRMSNAPKGMDAQVNVEYDDATGLYYANVYGSENGKEAVLQMDGLPDLKATIKTINDIDPTFIRSILKK